MLLQPIQNEAQITQTSLFGLGFSRVRTTIARGCVVVDEGRLPGLDEEAIRARCVERSRAVWARVR